MIIVSFAQFGYRGEIVKVEADLRRGIPAIDIVGLPDGAVREARERMRAAIRNAALDFPRERILINLSPADLKKEGSAFDLPIALAVLNAADPLSAVFSAENGKNQEELMVLGELELSGAVRPVRGILSAVSRGLQRGIRWYMVPKQNVEEAQIRKEACVIGVESITEAAVQMKALRDRLSEPERSAEKPGREEPFAAQERESYTIVFNPGKGYEDVRGQNRLIRALQIAAAGGHNLIAYGPPGCGKTLALQRFPDLLPEMDEQTAVTVTRIHSLAGILDAEMERSERSSGSLLRRPPFREPHQNASLEGMIGGGKHCRPGEISLSHGGVLFLDECTQFRSSVLQALRVPLETGQVTISRAGKSDTFPSRFQLLLAVNPCPCGNFGTAGRICTCTPDSIEKYWKKMTAPLLDRIDLRISVQVPTPETLVRSPVISTVELKEEIAQARRIQWERRKSNGGLEGKTEESGSWQNAHMEGRDIQNFCVLKEDMQALFSQSMRAARLSARGGHGVLKVARTIADLEGERDIGEDHIMEAVQFRRWSAAVPDFL